MSENLRRQRYDLHVALLAQLAGDWPEDAGRAWLTLVIDQHRGVLVEPDVRPILAAGLLPRAHDHRLGDVTLLYLAGRDGVLDGHHHAVTKTRVPTLAAAQHPDDKCLARAGVVGDPEDRFLLNHCCSP